MLNATIIADTDTDVDLIRRALHAAGCSSVRRIPTDELPRLLCDGVARPDVLLVHAPSTRMLQRLASLDVPTVVACPEKSIDAAFLAGATECMAFPLRERELEGRIRQALRARGQQQFRRAHERRMADLIASLETAKSGLEHQLCVDALTEIATRRHVLAMLDAECKRATRDGKPIGVVMIDLDDFHAYNERYGHVAGDHCLKSVAAAVNRCLRRPSDFLGRYGGEELVAVLPNTDLTGTRHVAESIRAAVEALAIPHAGSRCAPVVTITAGLTSGSITSGLTPEDIIQAADTALRHAKASGRNQVCATYEHESHAARVEIGRATTTRLESAEARS